MKKYLAGITSAIATLACILANYLVRLVNKEVSMSYKAWEGIGKEIIICIFFFSSLCPPLSFKYKSDRINDIISTCVVDSYQNSIAFIIYASFSIIFVNNSVK